MSERSPAAAARLVGPLAIGLGAIVVGTILGAIAAGGAGGGIAAWPPVVRAALVGLTVAIGLALLARALIMLAETDPDGAASTPGDHDARDGRDARTMIRAVRLVFLAVAAFAAAGAWLVASPLLLVVSLIIAGVDVLETSFLLVVARSRDHDDGTRR